jgi:hypothetical protein
VTFPVIPPGHPDGGPPLRLPPRQSTRTPRIGYISPGAQGDQPADWLPGFREGLRQAGYIEGQNILVEYRWADGDYGRLPGFATELVGRYKAQRRSLPAIALNADGALMSCIANDFGWEKVFSRQLAGLGRPGASPRE